MHLRTSRRERDKGGTPGGRSGWGLDGQRAAVEANSEWECEPVQLFGERDDGGTHATHQTPYLVSYLD